MSWTPLLDVVQDWHWHPCEHPERPLDQNVSFHVAPPCTGCIVVYEAAQAPPTKGCFDGWHRHWSPDLLAALRAGDLHAAEKALIAAGGFG